MSVARELQRWKKHLWLNLATGFSFLAILSIALALMDVLLPHNRSMDRANPLYWALVLPCVIWGVKISDFNPWAMLIFRKVCVLILISATTVIFWLYLGQVGGAYAKISSGLAIAFSLAALLISRMPFFDKFLADVRTIPKKR